MTTTQPNSIALTPALRVSGLRVAYGPIVAVDSIDLEVREGEIYGLLGPNGAGKTSALSAIEGLLRPAAGDIMIGDVDARAHPLQAKAQLGVQLQTTSFHSSLTLVEIVRLYAGLYGVTLTSAQIRELLGQINLQNEASKRFRQLSGGQQQRQPFRGSHESSRHQQRQHSSVVLRQGHVRNEVVVGTDLAGHGGPPCGTRGPKCSVATEPDQLHRK
ncbi:MAG TPA: ABC transporter ATP-binding protein [Candidatus Dormibacteraeota bacterium]|nr:ABC transporter ATP-binding protein [Candidatus Dormibacteraeota bacterium]